MEAMTGADVSTEPDSYSEYVKHLSIAYQLTSILSFPFSWTSDWEMALVEKKH